MQFVRVSLMQDTVSDVSGDGSRWMSDICWDPGDVSVCVVYRRGVCIPTVW